jgi:signal recognition particle subunit SRP54
MFEGIQRSLKDAFRKLSGRGRLTEENMQEGLKEVRKALLDADVNFTVANDFIKRVGEKARGQEVVRRINPTEQIINIIYQEMVELMGPVDSRIHFAKDRPTIIMLCGLQGCGKTTTAGKLALTIRDRMGRQPLLVAADLQRPAAVAQLQTLGEQLGVQVYSEGAASTDPNVKGPNPIDVCRNAIAFAKKNALDTIILDTAGRLHIAEMPMDELKQIDRLCKPDEIYLVADAMTGQDAVNSSRAFNEALDINGVILTKLDGDARGGAALSIKEVTQVPIKWVGVGEKLDKLEEFRPEGMAQRILGQGDIMALVQKVQEAQQEVSEEEMKKQQEKLEKGNFTLDDFRKQFEQMAKMGGIKQMAGMMPGMSDMIPEGEDPELAFKRIQGMIDSMTKTERKDPDVIDIARRRRIAAGSGTQPQEIKQFLNQFAQIRTLMRQLATMSVWERIKMVTGMSKSGMLSPGGMLPKQKIGTGKRKSPKERAEERKKNRKKKK